MNQKEILVRLNLKSKLLFLSFLPIAFIVILFSMIIVNTLENKHNLETVKKHIIEAKAISRIIHCMQIERGLSATFIWNKNDKMQTLLNASRKDLDRTIADYNYMISLMSIRAVIYLKAVLMPYNRIEKRLMLEV